MEGGRDISIFLFCSLFPAVMKWDWAYLFLSSPSFHSSSQEMELGGVGRFPLPPFFSGRERVTCSFLFFSRQGGNGLAARPSPPAEGSAVVHQSYTDFLSFPGKAGFMVMCFLNRKRAEIDLPLFIGEGRSKTRCFFL